ncbi:ATP-binding protein, partial [Streptococcus pneumoniae]|uniref:ATP-binding protein n=1 Tax=Streptococcus pneumoniae TaxID=1313 RepID=UPI001CB772C0
MRRVGRFRPTATRRACGRESTLLVAACNPCACGGAACDCSASEQRRYARKLSGPILDRIDIVCELCATRDLDADASRGSLSAHRDTASVRARVNAA